jgi:lysylphosphatidylglycerol synthetase-like protein (DUF2156 family)
MRLDLWANFGVGFAAVVLMSLVLVGHGKASLIVGRLILSNISAWIRARRSRVTRMAFVAPHSLTPGDLMRFAIAIFHIKGLTRIGYYDVFRLWDAWERSAPVSIANSGFSLMAIVASLSALAAMFYVIPEHERRAYTWLSAPWYPSPPPLVLRHL